MWSIAAILVGASIYFFWPMGSDQDTLKRAQEIFGVIQSEPPLEPNSVAFYRYDLGRELFFERRISGDGRTACASCHTPKHYGADPHRQSSGAFGVKTPRNTQSVLNLKHQHFFHWRLDRQSIEDQAEQSFTDPHGLANASASEAIKKMIQADYTSAFQKAFPDEKNPVSIKNASLALADFQRRLVTPAPFDRYLQGDTQALTKSQKKGLKTFMKQGCVSCHNGPAIGGRDFQKFGLSRDYWHVTQSEVQDLGRQAVTMRDSDRNVFKVPSLRNVLNTAPYFHDGSAPNIQTAIRWMGRLQLEKDLTEPEIQSLIDFFSSLTGDLPSDFK